MTSGLEAAINLNNLGESAETQEQASNPQTRPNSENPLNNHQRRAERYKRFGQTPSDFEKEWRAYKGESPNPWMPATSHDRENGGGFRGMQIISGERKSKLELRSEALDALERSNEVCK